MKIRTGCLLIFLSGVGLLVFLLLGYRILVNTFPPTKGNLMVTGLADTVRVYRDGFSVPHVFARTDRDLAFAQGFVTAQDRLWQMEILRRTASGRLSEILGRQSLGTDSLMGALGIRDAAERIGRSLPDSSRFLLNAYTEGVNACIRAQAGRLPLEFALLNADMSPWTIEDCIAVLRLHAWVSNPRWQTSLVLEGLARGMNRLRSTPVPGPVGIRAAPTLLDAAFRGLASALDEPFVHKTFSGQLAVAVPGIRSTTGFSMLFFVPSGPSVLPSAWYPVYLRGGRYRVSGLSLPGFPLVVHGHNDSLAWVSMHSATGCLLYSVESFLIRNNETPRVRTSEGWRETAVMEDSIRIKDERSIPARRFRINDRPVLWMAPVRGDTVVEGLSLDWSGLRPSDEAAVLDRVARARNHGEASDALRDWTVSTGVWFFADRTGEVAYKTAGSVCKPSGDGRREWIRFASAPLETPDHRNLLAGTGEWITDGKTSLPLTAQAQSDFRMIRLQALLSTKDTLSPADLKSIQADEVSMDAQRMLLILLSPLSRTSWTDPMERKGVELLKAWDGRMNPGSAGAALVEILFQRLSENRFLRAFGEPLYSLFAGYPNLAMQALHETWSNAAANRPSLDTLAVMSFRETIAAIRNLCGEDPAEWTWGAVHTVTFEHPLRSNTLLDKAGMAAAGPFPVGGSSSTLSFWEHPLQIPFTVKGCASARLLWDVGNLNNSIAVIPAGQSGQPMNNHYKDQLPLYLDQCFRPELWDDTKVLNAGWECLSFIPVQAAQ